MERAQDQKKESIRNQNADDYLLIRQLERDEFISRSAWPPINQWRTSKSVQQSEEKHVEESEKESEDGERLFWEQIRQEKQAVKKERARAIKLAMKREKAKKEKAKKEKARKEKARKEKARKKKAMEHCVQISEGKELCFECEKIRDDIISVITRNCRLANERKRLTAGKETAKAAKNSEEK